jgi:hypothetical protein
MSPNLLFDVVKNLWKKNHKSGTVHFPLFLEDVTTSSIARAFTHTQSQKNPNTKQFISAAATLPSCT